MTTQASTSSAELLAFQTICEQGSSTPEQYLLASDIQHRIPIYDSSTLLASSPRTALSELHAALEGPGVLVVRGAIADSALLDRTDAVLQQIIAREKAANGGGADHFATGGANDRVWNSAQKVALASPADYVEYFASPVIALVCQAWLGPGYQMTAQANNVLPGGAAQEPHRDYHLGFASEEAAARYPLATHLASQYLTLQGAVAHSDMPLASGPTQFLPFSQRFEQGYLAYRRPEFKRYFADHFVQLPLARGDAIFFNPGLHHAAGTNTTETTRSANLLQVSSAMGRAMETIDRPAVVLATWTAIKALFDHEGRAFTPRVQAAIAAVAEGYAFPTNLDLDPPPASGHAPPTQQDLLVSGLRNDWSQDRMAKEVAEWERKRRA